MKRIPYGTIGICGALVLACLATVIKGQEQRSVGPFSVSPIGYVRVTNDKPSIVLETRYEPGLLGLEAGSHIYVYWWFDRNDTLELRGTLQIHPNPPGNMAHPLTGVFACRSPYRPNLIGMTLCKVLAVRQNVIEIDAIDAFADTPVLDIKPYSAGLDTPRSEGTTSGPEKD
jgi:tRNA (adenine37-N6)-methyltransferase